VRHGNPTRARRRSRRNATPNALPVATACFALPTPCFAGSFQLVVKRALTTGTHLLYRPLAAVPATADPGLMGDRLMVGLQTLTLPV
jgi:hypothetical protein